jgi:hypothetical protein
LAANSPEEIARAILAIASISPQFYVCANKALQGARNKARTTARIRISCVFITTLLSKHRTPACWLAFPSMQMHPPRRITQDLMHDALEIPYAFSCPALDLHTGPRRGEHIQSLSRADFMNAFRR